MNNLKESEEQARPPKVRRKKEIPYFLRTLHQILQVPTAIFSFPTFNPLPE